MQARWKWVVPGKTFLWCRIRSKWRLCQCVGISEWKSQRRNGVNVTRPWQLSVIDVAAAMRGEDPKPQGVAFNKCKRLMVPQDKVTYSSIEGPRS